MAQAIPAVRGAPCGTPLVREKLSAMRAVVQRVSSARVTVDEAVVGAIGPGLLVLLGVAHGRHPDRGRPSRREDRAASHLRATTTGSSTCSVLDTGGEILVVSQFTLLADTTKGNRPGFSDAARPEVARAARRALLRRPFRPRRLGRNGRLRRPDERRARQRRTCHDRPRLSRTAARVAHACGRCYPLSTAFHCLTKWARGAHFC